MTGIPDYANPPIVELVIGAQFSPLTKLTAGHFGLFWKEIGGEWTVPADEVPIQDQFELFDRPRRKAAGRIQVQLEPVRLPGRFTLSNANEDRLLQLQTTRFHLNWRKREGFYPSYRQLIAEFEETFARFTAFAEREGLGAPALNQWELIYVDSFPRGEYWNTPADWATVLPGLFGQLFPTGDLGIVLEQRAARWDYEIQPKLGRLHVSAAPGWVGKEALDTLLLNTTARGPIGEGGAESLRAGLETGHRAALGVFDRVVSDEAKRRWGIKQ